MYHHHGIRQQLLPAFQFSPLLLLHAVVVVIVIIVVIVVKHFVIQIPRRAKDVGFVLY
jgi:hypothetical protein